MLHFHEREIRKYRGDYSKSEHIIDFVTNRFLTTPVDSSLSSALKYLYLHIIIYIYNSAYYKMYLLHYIVSLTDYLKYPEQHGFSQYKILYIII